MALLLAALIAAAQTTGATQLDPRRQADRTPTAVPAGRAPTVAPPPAIADAPTTTITGIRFVGAHAPARVAAAAKPFLHHKASRATLTALAAALSDGYNDGPVALYSVAIPAQDFAHGVVVVSLTEGRIASVRVKGSGHGLLRRRLARLTEEKPLSRATWERRITLAQAIPGLTVATTLTDPAATGALTLAATPTQKRTRFTLGFSNRGVDLLGAGQWDASATLYGGVVDGDQLVLSASAAADLRGYRYVAAAYSAPLGADGLTASANAAYLETRPQGYPLVGHAKQAGVTLAYPLVRGFHRSADVSLGADALDSHNATIGSVIADERTRAVRLAASVADTRTRRVLSASVTLAHGLPVLGAAAEPGARAAFRKATASAAASHAIGKRLVARVTASGQWSPDALPAAERLGIGGDQIGRAFDTGLLSGDRGGGGSGELAFLPLRQGRLAASELYLFGDGGAVRILPRPGFAGQRYSLASAGAGARARWRSKAELVLEVAHVLDQPYPGYDERWRATIEWKLSL